MADEDERRRSFEARLAELKRKWKLPRGACTHVCVRRQNVCCPGDENRAARAQNRGPQATRHRGSYGHDNLTDLATELEKRASLSPPPMLSQLAQTLAQAAEDVGQRSSSTPNEVNVTTLVTARSREPWAACARSLSHQVASACKSLRPAVQGATGGALRVLAMDDDPTTLRLLRLN